MNSADLQMPDWQLVEEEDKGDNTNNNKSDEINWTRIPFTWRYKTGLLQNQNKFIVIQDKQW